LQQAGLSIHLIGSSHLPSAANVAAGIINPVTGRWMTKSWRCDDFGPEAAGFYAAIERQFAIKVYHPLSAVRFCLNADDARRARRRSRNPRYARLLGAYRQPDSSEHTQFNNPHGCIHIHAVAYVDLPRLIQTLQAHFQAAGHYEDLVFDHHQLRPAKTGWCYRNRNYDRVIFCEGAALDDNPWFRHLPLTPAKGETLLCRCDGLRLDGQLYHHDKWLLPYPDGSFRIGATYDAGDRAPAPTAAAKDQLCQAFEAMTTAPRSLRILDQPAGIRPSTSDARPFLGAHPVEPGLYLFNGLGSKGASLAPTLSRELTEYLLYRTPLDPETDIQRFTLAIHAAH